jgi:hypothetical protein
MNDPFGERLRSYYQSIQGYPPAGLEARVSRGFDAAPPPRPAAARWRPAFGVAAAGVALLVVALVVRDLGPGPVPSQSPLTGPSESPTATSTTSPSATATEAQSLGPTPTEAPSETPAPTPAPTPTHTPAPTPVPTLVHTVGQLVHVGAMVPDLTGPSVNLNDATVLVVGGTTTNAGGVSVQSNLAELYRMSNHTFVATGSMAQPRSMHTATLLRDGRVLVVGGSDFSDGFNNLATAEIYDPITGRFTATGSMAQGRAGHTATLLADGRVLITGGFGGGTLPLASAEIYDPATGKFTPTGSMTVARMNHTATLLAGGTVLVTGGADSMSNVLSSAEIYDVISGTFHAIASMTAPRQWQTATTLGDDRVLIVGGVRGGSSPGPATSATAEIYDPSTGRFSATGTMKTARYSHTATLLNTGQVVVAGGVGTNSLEVYWPDTGKFTNWQVTFGSVSAAASLSDRILFTGNPPGLYCSWPPSVSPCG